MSSQNKDFIYSQEFESQLKSVFFDFVELYEDFQEGRVGFQFEKGAIEVSSRYAESCEPDFLCLMLKAMRRSGGELEVDAVTQEKAVLHAYVMGDILYEQDSYKQTEKERVEAQRHVDYAHLLLSQKPLSEASDKLVADKTKLRYFSAIMDSFNVEHQDNRDKIEVNKQGESVRVRSLSLNGEFAGTIRYIENDASVTIIRTDVEPHMQRKGVATKAYMHFADEVIAQGKILQSDSIVSKNAQKIYQKMIREGYVVRQAPSRSMSRGQLNSMTPSFIKEQMATVPLVHDSDTCAITHEQGYRLKGNSVYTVHQSPNVRCDNRPIEIAFVGEGSRHEVTFRVYPHKIVISELTPLNLESEDAELFSEVDGKLRLARLALTSQECEEDKGRLSRENISIWKETVISRNSMDLALNALENKSSLER